MATPIYYPPSVNNLQKEINANYTAGDATVTLNNVVNVQNKPGVCVANRVNSAGNRQVVSKWTYLKFTGTSGNTLTGVTAISGDQDHGIGEVVEFVPDVTWSEQVAGGFATLLDATDVSKVNTTNVITPDGTQTLTNKTLTSPTVNTPTIATPTINGSLTLDTAAQTSITDLNAGSLFKQSLINGNMDVWQRGTSIANTTANSYTADRWYVETATAGTDKTVSREDGTGVAGSYYCTRVKFVSDVDELLTFSQALESQDSIKFRGKKLTLSFYARGGAEFVADNATLVSKIVTGKGTDQKVLAFTTSADAVSQNNTLTTGWQKFTCTTTEVIAADITQVGVSFAFTHAGSGTTSNYFELTQVQLCAGDVALPFQPKSYEEELRACQRYCKAYTSTSSNDIVTHGVAVSETVAYVYFFFDTPMRVAPTITATAGDWKIGFPSGALLDVTGITGGSGFDSDRAFMANVTTASGLTAGYPQILVNDGGGTRTLILDAEL